MACTSQQLISFWFGTLLPWWKRLVSFDLTMALSLHPNFPGEHLESCGQTLLIESRSCQGWTLAAQVLQQKKLKIVTKCNQSFLRSPRNQNSLSWRQKRQRLSFIFSLVWHVIPKALLVTGQRMSGDFVAKIRKSKWKQKIWNVLSVCCHHSFLATCLHPGDDWHLSKCLVEVLQIKGRFITNQSYCKRYVASIESTSRWLDDDFLNPNVHSRFQPNCACLHSIWCGQTRCKL